MGSYGEAALKAVKLHTSGKAKSPSDAWKKATIKMFGQGTSSQKKGCPRNAFLGLCEEGLVKGIPPGNYTRSKKNKEYAIKAVKILQGAPELSSNSKTLWNKVIKGGQKVQNQQMEIVIALWNNNLIEG